MSEGQVDKTWLFDRKDSLGSSPHCYQLQFSTLMQAAAEKDGKLILRIPSFEIFSSEKKLNWKHQNDGWKSEKKLLNYFFLCIKLRYFSSSNGRRQKSLILYHFWCSFDRKLFRFKSFSRSQNFPVHTASLRLCWWKRAEKRLPRVKNIFNDSSLNRLADFLRHSFSRVVAFLENRWNRFKLKANGRVNFLSRLGKVFSLRLERVPRVKWFHFSPEKFRGKSIFVERFFSFCFAKKLSWSEPKI